MINRKVLLPILGMSLILTACEDSSSTQVKTKAVQDILTTQETTGTKTIVNTTEKTTLIKNENKGLDIDAIASGDFSSITGLWSMEGSEYTYNIRKNDIVVENFPQFKVVNTYKENGSAIIVYDTPGPTGGSEMGAIVVIPAGKSKPVDHMSEVGDKSKDRVLFVSPQKTTREMVKGGSSKPKAVKETPVASNKAVNIKSGYAEIAGRYEGDNGKEYIFNVDGTLEIDGVVYNLGNSNKSRSTRTNEEFINYNLTAEGSKHAEAYVEVYVDRIEIAYSGPAKSTKLKKVS